MLVNMSAAYGVYPHCVALGEVLQTLAEGGFQKESICMMLSPAHPVAAIVRESGIHVFEREASAVTAGLIHWLSEFGAVLIPTFGLFISSREYFRTLMVEKNSIAGCCKQNQPLVRLGFSEEVATQLENQVREVGVLVYVSCPETAQTQWALELLRATGAEEAGLVENEAEVGTVA